jgi:hypothetical protein
MASQLQDACEAMLGRLKQGSAQAAYLFEAPPLGPDDVLRAVVLGLDPTEAKWQGVGVLIGLVFRVQALVFTDQADVGDDYKTALDMIADAQRSIETDDRTLGGRWARSL